MAVHGEVARARERIEGQVAGIGRLRGSGPNPADFDRWNARTIEVLTALYGEGSAEVERYRAAAATTRLPGVRGQAENMTLNIHGQWGIRARLDRAEDMLRALSVSLEA